MPATFRGLRGLLRSAPGSGLIVVSLAIGVGATAAVWTAAAELLWAPLPYPEPDRLVALAETNPRGQAVGVALENLLDLREAETLAYLAAYRPRSFGLRRERAQTIVLQVGLVTEDFFRAVGVAPIAGRDFEGAEEAGAIIVSRGVGRLGEVVLLNEEPRTIIGLLPEGFRFPMAGGIVPSAYIPLSHGDYGNKRSVRTLDAVGRLDADASVADAESEARTIAARLGASFPETNAGFDAAIVPLHAALTSRNEAPVRVMAAVATSLLLIVVVNLANVFLARRGSRADEFDLRRALGARPWDLFAQLFAENAVLAAAGTTLGLLTAQRALGFVPTVLAHLGGGSVEPPSLRPEVYFMAFGLGVAIATVFAVPAAPRLRSRASLIIAQVALGVVLVQSTVLLGRSLAHLSAVDPGFEAERLLTFGLGLPEAVYDTEEKLLGFHRRLLEELETIPGVMSAGTATGRLLAGGIPNHISFRHEGAPDLRIDWPTVSTRIASPGYFETLEVPLLRGRGLSWADDAAHPPVVLVNRAFEKAYMETSAVGRRLELSWREGELCEIVGVVADTRQIDLATDPVPEIVLSLGQFPGEGASYSLRVTGMDEAIVTAARETVSRLDGRLQTVAVRPAATWIAASLANERLSLSLAAVVSMAALVLAAIGIYGLVTVIVIGRRREMAIRLALGAEAVSIRALVAGEGLKLVAIGTVVGAVAFASTAPWLRSLLFELEPSDLGSSLVTLAFLFGTALAACWSPARAAARTPIAEGLRSP